MKFSGRNNHGISSADPGHTYWGSLPGSAVTALDNEATGMIGDGWTAITRTSASGLAGTVLPFPNPARSPFLGLGIRDIGGTDVLAFVIRR